MQGFFKDAVLDKLASSTNVAQFVSFGPDLNQRFARIHEYPPNFSFGSPQVAVDALLEESPERLVNIRTFRPEFSESTDFLTGFDNSSDVIAQLQRLSTADLYTIVNEGISMSGGIGGVSLGGLLEFAPEDNPRCVERAGTACLPRDLAIRLLETVYRFDTRLNYEIDERVEFTVHLERRGWLHEHTIIWEIERISPVKLKANIQWPNLFSEFVGDKAFGLLLADLIGLPVPYTTVISRHLPPFSFGRPTGTGEIWLRTCPSQQQPGQYTSLKGWTDPFSLLQREDPQNTSLVSVLAQEAIEPAYSGALLIQPDGRAVVEGVRGLGNRFMLGQAPPEDLPNSVVRSVEQLLRETVAKLGFVRLEWVHAGDQTWIVQVHKGVTLTRGQDLFPGTAHSYRRFEVGAGIENLRSLISEVQATNEGIMVLLVTSAIFFEKHKSPPSYDKPNRWWYSGLS